MLGTLRRRRRRLIKERQWQCKKQKEARAYWSIVHDDGRTQNIASGRCRNSLLNHNDTTGLGNGGERGRPRRYRLQRKTLRGGGRRTPCRSCRDQNHRQRQQPSIRVCSGVQRFLTAPGPPPVHEGLQGTCHAKAICLPLYNLRKVDAGVVGSIEGTELNPVSETGVKQKKKGAPRQQ